MTKSIHSSHLALRFYKGNGWSDELLKKYLIRGEIINQVEGQEVRDCWFLDHKKNSQLDFKKLMDDGHIGHIYRWDEGRGGQTDLEFLEGMNW